MSASRPVHFLHIRKTGGTAVKVALNPVAAAFSIRLHPHKTRLADVPESEKTFFVVRDPVARFVSGFNSRLRMGRPLRDRPWNGGEAEAFAVFKTAKALAEALSSEDPAALAAMRAVRHINQHQSDWIGPEAAVRARLADIVWIGWTETLGSDFEEIKRRLGLPASLCLPQDEVTSHRTPGGMDTTLGAAGRRAIERWYAQDALLLEFLKKVREDLR